MSVQLRNVRKENITLYNAAFRLKLKRLVFKEKIYFKTFTLF